MLFLANKIANKILIVRKQKKRRTLVDRKIILLGVRGSFNEKTALRRKNKNNF